MDLIKSNLITLEIKNIKGLDKTRNYSFNISSVQVRLNKLLFFKQGFNIVLEKYIINKHEPMTREKSVIMKRINCRF